MKKQKVINIIIIFVALIAIGFGSYFFYELYKLQGVSNRKDNEVNDLISKVSTLYLFPDMESPTVATVSDPAQLKSQSFFSLSEKGDKVLIFSKAGRAVLYRPSLNKIIEIISVNSLNNK